MDVIETQQERMYYYRQLINMASCEEEKVALKKTYEISRLIHIHHPDVIERQSWLLENAHRYPSVYDAEFVEQTLFNDKIDLMIL